MTKAPETISDCPRCGDDESYGCSWTSQEMAKFYADENARLTALVAAAYERAADVARNSRTNEPTLVSSAKDIRSDGIASAIRALTPADARAALDALIAEKVKAEREAILSAVPPQYAIYGSDRTDQYARGFCGGVESYLAAIRARGESQDG